jgi:hypothetical protein
MSVIVKVKIENIDINKCKNIVICNKVSIPKQAILRLINIDSDTYNIYIEEKYFHKNILAKHFDKLSNFISYEYSKIK